MNMDQRTSKDESSTSTVTYTVDTNKKISPSRRKVNENQD